MTISNNALGAVIASALVLCATLGAPQAFAEDQKVYHGTTCRPFYPADAAKLTAFQLGLFTGASAAYITCPIVRDNVANLNGTKDAVVTVFNRRYIDANAGCTLWSTDQIGNTVASKGDVADPFSGDQELNVNVSASVSGGSYSMTCWLPPYSGIRSYRINEF